jgi:hypothetical protein
MPVLPANIITVNDAGLDVEDSVAVTTALESAAGATADQISEVPRRVFTRRTSVHVDPAPDTVAACVPVLGPWADRNATIRSPALIGKPVVVRLPMPSEATVRVAAGGGAGGWTTTLVAAVEVSTPLLTVSENPSVTGESDGNRAGAVKPAVALVGFVRVTDGPAVLVHEYVSGMTG